MSPIDASSVCALQSSFRYGMRFTVHFLISYYFIFIIFKNVIVKVGNIEYKYIIIKLKKLKK